jgi:hypothetical protein
VVVAEAILIHVSLDREHMDGGREILQQDYMVLDWDNFSSQSVEIDEVKRPILIPALRLQEHSERITSCLKKQCGIDFVQVSVVPVKPNSDVKNPRH